jgi:hypothetical protein
MIAIFIGYPSHEHRQGFGYRISGFDAFVSVGCLDVKLAHQPLAFPSA